MGVKSDSLFQRILSRLGASTVKVELELSDFMACLDEAVDTYSPYISETETITVVAGVSVDLRKKVSVDLRKKVPDILGVVQVYESPRSSSLEGIEFDPLAVVANRSGKVDLQRYATVGADMSELTYLTRPGYKFDGGILYLDGYYGNVTVEYYRAFSYETTRDEKATSWVNRYTMALCKELVGRKRSKFTPNALPMEFDGATLIQEADTEKTGLLTEITEQGLGDIIIMR